jgi:organic hydroperoxide reductase OsmC/OhrA
MLTFLWLASKAGWSAVRYHDEAYGVMTKNERRISWVSLVVLRPQVEWGGATRPSDDDVRQLHAQAHSECFIANSVRTTIQVETADTD